MIQGLIVLKNPVYVPQRWQATLLFYAVILVSLFFNTFLVKFLPKIESLVLVIHIGGFLGGLNAADVHGASRQRVGSVWAL